VKRNVLIAAIGAVAVALSLSTCFGAEEDAATSRQLFRDGARLWPVYCAQCHNARPGSEFAPYQWDTILMHMRTQANLPAREARAIVEYLKKAR
jgi:mono/diheme cytochrome c family protein